MTGENFKRIDRGYKLKSMIEKYQELSDKSRLVYSKLCDGEPMTTFTDYYEARERRLSYGDKIWEEAFYHYGRNQTMATQFVKQHGIETH